MRFGLYDGINNLEAYYKTDDCINKKFHAVIQSLADSIEMFVSFGATSWQLSNQNKPLKEKLCQNLIALLKDQLLDPGITI